ncbi:MAG: ATP-binding cassette domain-containing protein [Candidatus Cloacimonetes bacterium]|nr:ATP-binding cassette domain-containing protein [Candidatus Cloacimonadota bacterium]
MLQINDLHVVKEGKKILNGIDLQIDPGEKIVILGESGSGKSTLLKSIILFETITSGEIKFSGAIIDKLNVSEYRKNFIYISQKAPQSFSSVKEYICLPFQFRRNKRNTPEESVLKTYLENFNFASAIMEQNYNDLSGGEQQRITIIQALLINKPIFLLDEITSNLDKKNVSRVVEQILSERARSVIYVTHDTDNLDKFDKIYRLADGLVRQEVAR